MIAAAPQLRSHYSDGDEHLTEQMVEALPLRGNSWPRVSYESVPSQRDAAALARETRQRLGLAGRVSMTQCGQAAGIEFRFACLHVPEGGCEALLVPLRTGGFRVVVDPTPRRGWASLTPELRTKVARHRTRFRVAHELAHTFFYETGRGAPARRFPGGSSAEESFADAFARELLAPAPASPLSAQEVIAFRADYDVSLEVAARACAATSDPPRAVALWRWSPNESGPGPVTIQWTSAPGFDAQLGLSQRSTPPELVERLHRATTCGVISTAVLTDRCQVLAVAR